MVPLGIVNGYGIYWRSTADVVIWFSDVSLSQSFKNYQDAVQYTQMFLPVIGASAEILSYNDYEKSSIYGQDLTAKSLIVGEPK